MAGALVARNKAACDLVCAVTALDVVAVRCYLPDLPHGLNS
jgi:hypothetical protein